MEITDKIIDLIPLISIIATIGLGVLTWYTRRDNDKAEAASVLTGSALALVVALEKRVNDVEVDLEEEREKRKALQKKSAERESAYEMQMEKVSASHERQIASLRASVKELQKTVDTLEVELKEERGLRAKLERENAELKNGKGGRRV